MKKILFLLVSLFAISTFADGLGLPLDLDDASMLPKGVRSLKIKGFTTQAESKFDGNAELQPLGKPFTGKAAKFDAILKKAKSASEEAVLKGYMASLDINENTDLGSTYAFVSARATATVPVFAYGVSEKWLVAVAVPVVYSETYVDSGLVLSSEGKRFADYLASDTNKNKAEVLRQGFKNAVNNAVTQENYYVIDGTEQKTQIGDVRLVSKYLVEKNINYALALKQSVTLPTGVSSDPNRLIDIAAGDRQTDFGFGVVADWYIAPRVTVSSYADYTVQFSDTVEKRIPKSPTSPLSSDVDSGTRRDLGDTVAVGVALKMEMAEGLNVGTGYVEQQKYSDIYHGDKFSPERYDWMAQNTNQRLSTLQFGVGYSTVPLFKRKAFAVPADAKLNWTTVLRGENVTADDLYSFDVSLYF